MTSFAKSKMDDQKYLPKPELDLELPEKELTSGEENPPKESHFIKYVILGVLFVILLTTITGAYFLGKNKISTKIVYNSPTIKTEKEVIQKDTDFFYFSIPKPFENLELNDLPNTFEPENVVKANGNLWFASGGSIIEYDPKENKLVSYSNLAKANCDRNILYVNEHICTFNFICAKILFLKI